MNNSRPVEYLNVLPTMTPVRYWRKKRGQYLISPTGRWGGSWLWRLVFQAAKNLGMVGWRRESTDGVIVSRLDITQSKGIREGICQACDPYLEAGHDYRDLVCIMGHEFFQDLAMEVRTHTPDLHYHALVRDDMGYPKGTKLIIFDVPVVATPFMKGIVVLPRSYFR